tara:strand:- start:120 stop:323 length:204 start_codon:yes stop_codon:yes gene_type:complete
MKTKTQAQKILSHLKRGWKITQSDAFHKYGCWRLASRIDDLKKLGFNIDKKMIERGGKKFAQYYLPR